MDDDGVDDDESPVCIFSSSESYWPEKDIGRDEDEEAREDAEEVEVAVWAVSRERLLSDAEVGG